MFWLYSSDSHTHHSHCCVTSMKQARKTGCVQTAAAVAVAVAAVVMDGATVMVKWWWWRWQLLKELFLAMRWKWSMMHHRLYWEA